MNDELGTTLSLTGLVKGRVQGVFFRAGTQAAAQRLGIHGWVRNTVEGHVEVLISGNEEAVREMQSWLLQGPRTARVDSLELQECQADDLQGFEIRY
jgi:acylphosphatase